MDGAENKISIDFHELQEIRNELYENYKIYKSRMRDFHDKN